MIRVGIDASSSCTGLSIFEDDNLIYYTKIRPHKNIDFRSNSCQIIEQVVNILNDYEIDIIYMEDVPEFMRQGSHGKQIIKTLVVLGAVQGMFYQKLCYEFGYKIEYIGVHEWRKKLGFLEGKERDRESQKQKAIDYVNEHFGLNLHFEKGKKNLSQDDDIAEAILIAYSSNIDAPKSKKFIK